MNIKFRLTVFAGYIIPVFGWMIPMYIFRKDEDVSFHARQSFILSVIFIINLILMFFIDKSMPIQYDYVANIFYLFLIFVYSAILFLCALKVIITGKASLPVINDLALRLPL
jgi:uncharacterized membrane protein